MSTLKRITWDAVRRHSPQVSSCGECSHITPTDEYLSVKERRPILGSCPFSKYLRLLSDRI